MNVFKATLFSWLLSRLLKHNYRLRLYTKIPGTIIDTNIIPCIIIGLIIGLANSTKFRYHVKIQLCCDVCIFIGCTETQPEYLSGETVNTPMDAEGVILQLIIPIDVPGETRTNSTVFMSAQTLSFS